jgi:predicted MPP superfamily phosphohydrolase
MAIDFSKLLDQIWKEVLNIVTTGAGEFVKEATADAKSFLNKAKDDLLALTQDYAAGKLSDREYKHLVLGLKNLAEMEGLKQAGLAQIKIDEIKNNILNTIVDTVKSLI